MLVAIVIAIPIGGLLDEGWRMRRMHTAIHVGMSVSEVLSIVHEPALVHGVPLVEGVKEIKDIVLMTDGHGAYSGMFSRQTGKLTADQAAAAFKDNMVAAHDYRIIFTFFQGYARHWSLPVDFSPDGRVKNVPPGHAWD